MKFLQFCIMVLVIGSNGTYHWTDNGYAAGVIGILAAAFATVIIVELLSLLRRTYRSLKHLRDQ
jgi:ABC-type Co2+ transport system permease subunit